MKVNIENVKKKDITKAKIVEATLNLISQKGVDGVTYRRISKMSSVSLSSLTYHFKDRNDLIAFSFKTLLNRIKDQAYREKEKSDKDLSGMLDSLVRHFRWKVENPGLIEAEYELILFSKRNEATSNVLSLWEGEFELWLAELLEKLSIENPLFLARLLMNVYYGYQIRYLNNQENWKDNLRLQFDVVIAGMQESSPKKK